MTDESALSARPWNFQTAVEAVADPGAVLRATARITDPTGAPVLVGGVALTLAPMPAVADEARSAFGTLTPGHRWVGFQSSPPMPFPAGPGVRRAEYRVEYQVCGSSNPLGGGWFGDDSDEVYGTRVTEAYAVFGSLGYDSRGRCVADRIRQNCSGLSGAERAACAHEQSRACGEQNPGP